MASIDRQEAAARARAVLGLPDDVPGEAMRVRRLEPRGGFYYLVWLGTRQAAQGVVCVDEATGEVESWARLPAGPSTLIISETQARQLAGLGPDAQAELVWKPSRASRSMLYPIWEIVEGAVTVCIDQQGRRWVRLENGGPGG